MATIVPVQDKESGRLLGTLPRPRPVTICECGDHAFTNLTKWGITLVSPQDAHLLEANAWFLSTHGYAMVALHKASGLYRAYYWKDGKQKSAGYFRDKLSAAQARDRACIEHIGPIQTLNFADIGGSHVTTETSR